MIDIPRCTSIVLALGLVAGPALAQSDVPLVPASAAPSSGVPLVAPSAPSVPLVAPGSPEPAPAPSVPTPAATPTPAPAPAPVFVPSNDGATNDAGVYVPANSTPAPAPAIFVPSLDGSTTAKPLPSSDGMGTPTALPAPATAAASPARTDGGVFVPSTSPTAGVAATTAPATTASPAPAVNGDFVKGDLSTLLGATKLVDKYEHVGVAIGVNEIQGTYYALVEPELDLHFGSLSFGLIGPLNLEVIDPHVTSTGQFQIWAKHPGEIRPQDWATWQQYLRVLNYLTYGHKEDHLYINFGQVYADTLGHGEIMRRYQPNIDINTLRVSGEVDAYNDYVGVEALTNDIARWDIIGGLAFVKPGAFFSDNAILRSLSIGVTGVVDRTAPKSLDVAYTPDNQNSLNGCACQPVEDSSGNLITTTGLVGLGGVDAEIKWVKTEAVDIKTYADVSHLFGGGTGATLGGLARINLGSDTVNAFRFVAELRYLGADYKPEYFDTFYEVDKYIYDAAIKRPTQNYVGTVINTLPAPQTQYQVVTQGEQGFGTNRGGYYAEASYGIRGYLGATLALEGDTGTGRTNFIAHLELPDLWILKLFTSYYKRDMTSFSDLTTLDTSTIILAGARIKILPILFVNLSAYQEYSFDSSVAHNYVSSQGVAGNLEFGYEF